MMKKIWRMLRVVLAVPACLIVSAATSAGTIWLYFHPAYTTVQGVIYGRRGTNDLTLDVITPAKPNGIGIAVMASGSWKSRAGSFDPWITAALLRRGYTLFAVYHVPQPKATVMEIVADVNRALRFIRSNATNYHVDPKRLGISGGSSGGHLSLMLATRGGPGPGDASTPVERASSAVQAVAIFYPVTDLLNLGASTENLGDGGPPKSFVKAFGPQSTNLAIWKVIGRDMSPIYHITSNLPPVLIYHGDADTLVPLDQSQRFQAKALEMGRTVELAVHPGGQHGWLTMVLDVRKFADWFDKYLRGEKAVQVSWAGGNPSSAEIRQRQSQDLSPVAG